MTFEFNLYSIASPVVNGLFDLCNDIYRRILNNNLQAALFIAAVLPSYLFFSIATLWGQENLGLDE